MIELKNLTKVYETVNYNVIALSDINYKLDAGEIVPALTKYVCNGAVGAQGPMGLPGATGKDRAPTVSPGTGTVWRLTR